MAFRPPYLALESLAVRELARRSVEITIESFGMSLCGAPVHAHGHRASITIRGRFVSVGSVHRPPNPPLLLTSELWKQRLRRCIL